MIRHINAENNKGSSTVSGSERSIPPADELNISYTDPEPTPLFKDFKINPGHLITISKRKDSEGCRMVHETENAPISFGYNLRHRVRCTISSGGKRHETFDRPPGSCVLSYLPKTKCTIETSPGESILGISVHFSVNTFRALFREMPSYLEDILSNSKKAPHFYQQSRVNSETALILNQIITCPYRGEVQRLFFEAKSLELLSMLMNRMEGECHSKQAALDRRDSERIREAYQILFDRIDAPPSLCELSQEVGINRNKLNKGFKLIYGETVFNVLRDLRLHTAWDLLLNSEMSLTEIALSIGYTNQANFTTAFRMQFGKTPLSVRQKGTSLHDIQENSIRVRVDHS